jgi:very-short-patch-repair endonuclease
MLTPDVRIGRIAARQHGVFAWTQALECGLTPKGIEHRLKAGRWRRLRRGVYTLIGAPATFERDVMAAVLAGGSGALATGRTAAALFRLDGVERKVLEIVVPQRRQPRIVGVSVHRSDVPRTDATEIDRIPVTTPARTLIDLARVVHENVLEDALDGAVRRKLVDPRLLEERLEQMTRNGRTGAGVLLRLVRKRTVFNVAGSLWENKVRRVLTRAGLPEPVRQFVITDERGDFVARVDLAYPENRIYIEYDGGQHADPRQRAADLERQNRLTALGWRPLRFIDADFKKPPDAIVAKVSAARRFSAERA